MKNSANLGGCYPPRPLASVHNTLLDLQNSSYPTQPHSIIAKYHLCINRSKRKNNFCSPVRDLNSRPLVYKTSALTTELTRLTHSQ